LELFSIKDVVRVASFGKLVSFQVSSDNWFVSNEVSENIVKN
jgi:hypothetical protein